MIVTGSPATAFATAGVMRMSLSWQGPVGSGSGVGLGVIEGLLEPLPFPGFPDSPGLPDFLSWGLAESEPSVCVAAAGVAESGSDDPSLESERTFPMASTSTRATLSTASRRRQ